MSEIHSATPEHTKSSSGEAISTLACRSHHEHSSHDERQEDPVPTQETQSIHSQDAPSNHVLEADKEEQHAENNLEEGVTIPKPTLVQKLGKIAICILAFGTAVILGVVGFSAFLWFASDGNATWRAIVLRNWLTKAITICSEILKQAVTFQSGVCGAMLASLALERFEVRLQDAASVSLMRGGLGSGKVLSLSKKQLKGRKAIGRKKVAIPALVSLTTIILALMQATSIVLISDVDLSTIPGNSKSALTAFGFAYKTENYTSIPHSQVLTRGTTWTRKAPFYSTFAEYSEPPSAQDGVDDTGLTLRAFIPDPSAQYRQDIHEYQGKTTVLDARVTCQVPSLYNETLRMPTTDYSLIFEGSVSASRQTPRLFNSTIKLRPSGDAYANVYNESIPFVCIAPTVNTASNNSAANEWRTVLCQLGEGGSNFTISGGLTSEFKDLAGLPGPNSTIDVLESSVSYGTAYLIVNVTTGSESTWQAITESDTEGKSPPEYSQQSEWLDLVYSNGSLILSVTLCYSAFDTADIAVKITSIANRTEPIPSFDFDKSIYTFDGVRELLGQYSTQMSLEERGALQLEPQRSWIANDSERPPVEPYMRDFANLAGPRGDGNYPNYTVFLWQAQNPRSDFSLNDTPWLAPEITLIWLFQEIIQTSGSIAFAIQSLITLLSSMAYYDQLAQFDNVATVDQVFFVTANTPQHYRGFLIVCIVLTVHLLLMALIVTMFIQESRFSMLGNSWQGMAQAVTPETIEYLSMASMMTDKQLKKKMKEDRRENTLVGLEQIDGSSRVGIMRFGGGEVRQRLLPKAIGDLNESR